MPPLRTVLRSWLQRSDKACSESDGDSAVFDWCGVLEPSAGRASPAYNARQRRCCSLQPHTAEPTLTMPSALSWDTALCRRRQEPSDILLLNRPVTTTVSHFPRIIPHPDLNTANNPNNQYGSYSTLRHSLITSLKPQSFYHRRRLIQSIRPCPLVRRQRKASCHFLHHSHGIRESRIQGSGDWLTDYRITCRP